MWLLETHFYASAMERGFDTIRIGMVTEHSRYLCGTDYGTLASLAPIGISCLASSIRSR